MTSLPALVLLHGVGDDGRCWVPFVDRLRSLDGLRELEVATPDAAGRLAHPTWEEAEAGLIARVADRVSRP